jgi:hypothetical protein
VIHAGGGKLADLVALGAPGFLGMWINWRIFGSAGRTSWQDGLVHRQFPLAAAEDRPSGQWVKSLFRRPDAFGRLGAHGPAKLDMGVLGGIWGQDSLRWIDSAGRNLRIWEPGKPYMRLCPPKRVTFAAAQLNHYMIRARENFEMKRGMPSSAAGVDRYNDSYLRLYDRNDVEEQSALRYSAEFDALHSEAMALPGIARLHHLCCADLVLRIGAKFGFDGHADPRYRAHMNRVGG